MHAETPAVWDFAAFTEGACLGQVEIELDAAHLALWGQVFGRAPEPEALSRSLLVSAMMEGYLKVAQPRPPGNIHAGQTLQLKGPAPKSGQRLRVTTRCKAAYERKGRKWVRFASEVAGSDGPLLQGEILTIWAR